MPKLRPRVCQKPAILGPASFQDAIWECFKCQRNATPLSSAFISFPPGPLSPWYLYCLHASSSGQSLQRRDPRPPGEALLCTQQLHFQAIYFCFLGSDSLTFLPIMPPWSTPSLLTAFLSCHDTEHSLSSVPAMHMDPPHSFWARTLVTWPELGTQSWFS